LLELLLALLLLELTLALPYEQNKQSTHTPSWSVNLNKLKHHVTIFEC